MTTIANVLGSTRPGRNPQLDEPAPPARGQLVARSTALAPPRSSAETRAA